MPKYAWLPPGITTVHALSGRFFLHFSNCTLFRTPSSEPYIVNTEIFLSFKSFTEYAPRRINPRRGCSPFFMLLSLNRAAYSEAIAPPSECPPIYHSFTFGKFDAIPSAPFILNTARLHGIFTSTQRNPFCAIVFISGAYAL